MKEAEKYWRGQMVDSESSNISSEKLLERKTF